MMPSEHMAFYQGSRKWTSNPGSKSGTTRQNHGIQEIPYSSGQGSASAHLHSILFWVLGIGSLWLKHSVLQPT